MELFMSLELSELWALAWYNTCSTLFSTSLWGLSCRSSCILCSYRRSCCTNIYINCALGSGQWASVRHLQMLKGLGSGHLYGTGKCSKVWAVGICTALANAQRLLQWASVRPWQMLEGLCRGASVKPWQMLKPRQMLKGLGSGHLNSPGWCSKVWAVGIWIPRVNAQRFGRWPSVKPWQMLKGLVSGHPCIALANVSRVKLL